MITNLFIKNFKSIKEGDFALGSLTLFTGLNAVGKSTVIQALLLLRQSLRERGFSEGLFLKDENYTSLGVGDDVISISAPEDSNLEFEVEWDFEHLLSLKFAQASGKDVLPLSDEQLPGNEFEWLQQALFDKNFQYLSASRISPRTLYKSSPYYVDELSYLGKEGEYAVHYLAEYKDSPISNIDLKHPNAKSDTLLDNVDAWMGDISPGVRIEAVYLEEFEIASLAYNFEIENGFTKNFKPTNVGFGLTYILPVITALMMLPKGGLLIVENPESHLHPAGQARIARLLSLAAAKGTQVIIESHSDHILNGIRVAVKKEVILPEEVNIYFFNRELNSPDHNSNFRSIAIDKAGKIGFWPQGFFDEWEKQLDQLVD